MKYGWRGVTKRRQAEGKIDFCHLLQIPKSVIALRGGWVVVWGTFFPKRALWWVPPPRNRPAGTCRCAGAENTRPPIRCLQWLFTHAC